VDRAGGASRGWRRTRPVNRLMGRTTAQARCQVVAGGYGAWISRRQHGDQRRSPATSSLCRPDQSLRGRRWPQGLASEPVGGHLAIVRPDTIVPCRRAYERAMEGSMVGRFDGGVGCERPQRGLGAGSRIQFGAQIGIL
jgi:hypothetical protein